VRKRSWGRLGAAVGAVALLAGGLVGVAGSAQAADPPGPLLEDTEGLIEYASAKIESWGGRVDLARGVEYAGYTVGLSGTTGQPYTYKWWGIPPSEDYCKET